MNAPKTRLLVVDDDRIVLAAMVALLSRAGFDVVVATNGAEARRLAAEVVPALAIFDAEMEGRRGIEFAESLSRETRVPFLLLARRGDDDVARQAAACGARGVLLKPVDATRMVPAIRMALEHAPEAAPARPRTPPPAGTQEVGSDPQSLIAIGILVERHRINCDQALDMLRQRAEASGQDVEAVALSLIEQAEAHARPPGK